jgi:hypothetical protein
VRGRAGAWASLVPILDGYGLHARACECARCAAGYGPTEADREAARAAHARAIAPKGSAAAKEAAEKRKAEALEAGRARVGRAVEATRDYLARPMPAPLTEDQLREIALLRRLSFGVTRRR